jgi:hypothetical protein
METQPNKLDDFFREALQEHAVVPSEAAKAAFLKEAATLEGSRKFYTHWYFYLSAIILVVLTGAGIALLSPVHSTKNTGSISPASKVANSSIDKKVKSNSTKNQSENKINGKENTASTNPIQKLNPPKNRNTKTFTSKAFASKNKIEHPEATPSSPIEKPVSGNPSLTSKDKQTVTQKPSEPTINPVPEPAPVVSTPPLSGSASTTDSEKKTSEKTTDSLNTGKSSAKNPKVEKGSNKKNLNFGIGLYYAPEWMFNTLEGEKYVNNFGIEGTFHFGRYSVRTGAGLSVTKGTHEVVVNYNDYLGDYRKLDSIAFNWNETHTKLLPTYYFTKENVWDSLLKVANAKIIKRYTYLQVPLILGYDFWENEHFSVGLRAGPILSVLLKTEQLSDNYDPGKNRVVEINMITPERIQTYWQFMLGVNAAYSISRRFGVEVEPDVRYYFNSVYEKPVNNKKPWSVGVRVALLFKN